MKHLRGYKIFESQSDIDIIKDILAYISDDFIVEVQYLYKIDIYVIRIYKGVRDGLFLEFEISEEIINGIRELSSQLNSEIKIRYYNLQGINQTENMLSVGSKIGQIILTIEL